MAFLSRHLYVESLKHESQPRVIIWLTGLHETIMLIGTIEKAAKTNGLLLSEIKGTLYSIYMYMYVDFKTITLSRRNIDTA